MKEFYKDKKVLVTGGAGFLGSQLVPMLKDSDAELFVPRSENYDLRNEQAVNQLFKEIDPEIVIHLAVKGGGIGFMSKNPGTSFYDNLMMGTLMLEHSRRNNIEKFVGIGSVCSYPKFTETPFREENLWEGYPEDTNAPYGLAKKMLLKSEEIGNAIYFSFDYKSKLATKFIEYLLALEENEFPKWLSVVFHNLKKFNEYLTFGLVFGSSVKNSRFNDIDVLLVYEKDKSRKINKIKEEIRTSQLIEQPIRYVDIAEKDILLNRDDKIFYNILSDSLIFYNSRKYVEVIRKCRR